MAENHPVGFQWVMEARKKGAKIIHVDPRFNRNKFIVFVKDELTAANCTIGTYRTGHIRS
jgi:hypothetical protein